MLIQTSPKMILLFLISFFIVTTASLNKYSAKANHVKNEEHAGFPTSLRELDKPYKMMKLNLLWTKAKNRLTDTKLQSIFSDLKIHDKEELAYKHFKSDAKDPEGLEQARLRKKLIGIMSTYGLLEYSKDIDNPQHKHKAQSTGNNYMLKDLFKDTRLNKLWAKAELTGFTHDELTVLKEEFQHHQEKVDEYMSLLHNVDQGDSQKHENSLNEKPESWNIIEGQEENEVPGNKLDFLGKANLLREKHLELRDGYDRLDRLTNKVRDWKEFIEPKVQGLWKVALGAKFSPEELESLKGELKHYETRLLKLRHLHTEAALEAARKKEYDITNSSVQENIKKHARTVEKLHMDLESKIMLKHTDL